MKHTLKRGFTLVELLMVITIIAIISTLAVNKLSGLKLDSEKRISYANIQRLTSQIDAFCVAGNKINALDSLLDYPQHINVTALGDFVDVTTNYVAKGTGVKDENVGAAADLRRQLCMYYLSTNDVTALDRVGFTKIYLAKTPSMGKVFYDEYETMMVGVANSPLMSMCYGKKIENGLGVAMVNPFSPDNNMTGAYGYRIYQDMGYDIRVADGDSALIYKGVQYTDLRGLFDALMTAGSDGILLAFGLGDNASMVGNANAGIDKSPTCPLVKKDEYPRYVLLFRLRTVAGRAKGQERELTFAGVLDSYGQTSTAAKETL